jgi:hypothetical protein
VGRPPSKYFINKKGHISRKVDTFSINSAALGSKLSNLPPQREFLRFILYKKKYKGNNVETLSCTVDMTKKTWRGRKSSSPTSLWASTQGAHKPPMTKKSWNQQIPVEKTSEPWPPITNGPTTTAHSATTQAERWHIGDGTREQTRYSEEIFLTRPEIHPTRESDPRPRYYSGVSIIWAEDLSLLLTWQ